MHNEKKDVQMQVRISSELYDDLQRISSQTNDKPSGLARLLIEQYVDAYKKHGRRVIYPPEYRLYAVLEKEQESHDPQKTEKKSNQRTA